MAPPRSRRPRHSLDEKGLEELALRYVGRYATTRAKLRTYLSRKVRERCWSGSIEPDFDSLVNRLSELGYVDDEAYAIAKSRALISRGYGSRLLDQRLRLAGVAEDERAAAREHAEAQAVGAALRYAKRRAIGPFAAIATDQRQREKHIAAMVRAGHSYALARAIAVLPPGADVDEAEFGEQSLRNLS